MGRVEMRLEGIRILGGFRHAGIGFASAGESAYSHNNSI